MLTFGTALSVPTVAAAKKSSAPTATQVCQAVMADPDSPFTTMAECMTFIMTADPVEVCQDLRRGGYLGEYGYNQGNCVSYLRNLQRQ
jgi:hypothetical protein